MLVGGTSKNCQGAVVSAHDFSGVHGINNNVGCGSSRGLCCSTYIISPNPFPRDYLS